MISESNAELLITLILLIIYVLPTIIGWKKKNRISILVLNLLLGWTFVGWVVAFVWAVRKD